MTWATERLEALKRGEATPPPVVQTLGLGTLDEWGEGWIRKKWDPTPELLNADGSMFGGYLAALADQALAFATMTAVPADALFRTINLQMNYVRVGRAHSLLIEARVIAATKQMITVRAEFRREDGELIAEASAQQLIIPFATRT
ncbi:PaaI family thioesterase [soil metagenome]